MDAELRAYLDTFRQEIRHDLAAAIAGAREENRVGLAAAMATAREENRADLAAAIGKAREENRADLAAAIGKAREENRADLAAAMATLRAEMRSEAVETRRHFDVVAEGLRGDIRLVAGGVVANTESIDRMRTDLSRDMDERFRVVHLAIGELRALIS